MALVSPYLEALGNDIASFNERGVFFPVVTHDSFVVTPPGSEEAGAITIEYARKFAFPRLLGTWTVPLKHVVRCANRAAFLAVNARLSKHLAAERAVDPPATRSASRGAVRVPNLSILDSPYRR